MAGPEGRGRIGRERGGNGLHNADAPVLLHRHAACPQGAYIYSGLSIGSGVCIVLSQGHKHGRASVKLPPTGRGGEFPLHTHTHTSTHPSQDEEAGLPATGGPNGDGTPQHRAIPLNTLDSFNGLSKNRVFEWNIKDYTVPRKKAESITILKDVGACVP